MFRPTARCQTPGRVFPEDMSPFTVRSFGVYFLALVLGALAVIPAPRPGGSDDVVREQ